MAKSRIELEKAFNDLLNECRETITGVMKVMSWSGINKLNTARYTIISDEDGITIVDPVEDVKVNLNEIQSVDKLMGVIGEIQH